MAGKIGYVKAKTFTLALNEEIDTGFYQAGAYVLYSSSSGYSSLLVAGAYTLNSDSFIYNKMNVNSTLNTNLYICFNRKQTNGNFYIQNLSGSIINISVIPL